MIKTYYYQRLPETQEGFVALVSAVVITALLLLITVALSYSGFFGRFNVLDTEYKKESVGYAEACVDAARIFIANTPGFSTNSQVIDVDPDSPYGQCTLNVSGTTPYTIQAQTIYENSYTNLRATVNRDSGAETVPILTWREVPNF